MPRFLGYRALIINYCPEAQMPWAVPPKPWHASRFPLLTADATSSMILISKMHETMLVT